ncbi:hypothetical protein EV130_104159 [Rhizobium azibense]|uniref:Uncharacterized protein n=1 Tax=Rhizobium azibense TaxID=1136135 RepID=A0A4R3QVU3_9HYPH|nr:hypothetical protein EV130_104159 [Rhizobium azibense]
MSLVHLSPQSEEGYPCLRRKIQLSLASLPVVIDASPLGEMPPHMCGWEEDPTAIAEGRKPEGSG